MNREVLEKAVDTYGLENQLLQGAEECAEFIQAVNKWRRSETREETSEAVEHLAEEIADCIIMMEQARIMVGEARVQRWINQKMERLAAGLGVEI